jgi:hypothetical protein
VIIFLGIDGVLNSTIWSEWRPLRGFIPPGTAQEAFDQERIDPHCVEYLRRIVDRTGAKLVLTSTWRHRMNVSEFVRLFALYGGNDAPVIGCTPRITGLIRGRGYEVEAWLGNNEYAAPYVCVDDDDFRAGQPLVQTKPELGLTRLDSERCIEILMSATRPADEPLLHCERFAMIHNSTSYNPMGDHYAVGAAINPPPYRSSVLAQLQEDGNQARVMLTPDEARHLAQLLLAAADKVQAHARWP